eukprot:gene10302-6814_t
MQASAAAAQAGAQEANGRVIEAKRVLEAERMQSAQLRHQVQLQQQAQQRLQQELAALRQHVAA